MSALLPLGWSLAALSIAPALPQDDESTRPEPQVLEHRVERWDWELPQSVWRPLGDTLELQGHVFSCVAKGRVLALDTDGDGKGDVRLRQETGNATLQPDGTPWRYAARFRRAGQGWEWAPGGSLICEVAGVPVRLLDLNGDGDHEDFGIDGMIVARSSDVGLLTRVARIDGSLHQIDVYQDDVGATLMETAPYEGAVATLDVVSEFKPAGSLRSLLVQSGDVFIDAAIDGGSILVPAGTYQVVRGRVSSGARSARVRPGRMAPIKLEAGQELTMSWGGKLEAQFSYTLQGDRLTVLPNLHFYDSLGAEFTSFEPVVAAPRINVLNAKTGRLVQYGRMGGCCGGGYTAWQATVPEGVELVVELEHKRRLFGKIIGTGTQKRTQSESDR